MRRSQSWLCILGLCVLGGGLLLLKAYAQPAPDPHQNMPEGFDFPAKKADLEKLRDQENVADMRKHAWMVFAGMTQPAPGGEAIWETWYSSDQTFSPGAAPEGVQPRRFRFRTPRQKAGEGIQPQAVGDSQLSFVMFNPVAHKFIRTKKLYLQETLNGLRTNGDKAVPDFPAESMSIKTAWWPIAKEGLTPMPIWDNEPTRPVEQRNEFDTWKRVVAVDPSRNQIPEGETADVKFFDPSQPNPSLAPPIVRHGAHVVPLSSFYNATLTQDDINGGQAENLKASFLQIIGREVQPGDKVALVCIHFTTKEIDDWVWGTAWWHDRPGEGPFAEGRVDQIKGPWRNYLMDTAFSMDTPKESDGKPNACFNPWLEAKFPNGTVSNCMTCHQRAVWPPVDFRPITRGSLKPDDPFFANKTRLDFLWSMALESKPTPPQ